LGNSLGGSYGETPLHQAIRGGNFPAVELLIRKGARVDLVGRDGYALEQAKRVLDQETYQKIESLVERVSFGANIANSVVDYQSLPPPVVEMATLAGLSSQSVNQNFDLFSDVVRFLTGTKYLTSPPDFEQVPFQPGNPLAVYEVESSSSGSGGFGQVFKARNMKTKLPVAVKVTANQTTKEFKANMNELRLLRRCQHKNVVFFLEAYNVVESQEVWVREPSPSPLAAVPPHGARSSPSSLDYYGVHARRHIAEIHRRHFLKGGADRLYYQKHPGRIKTTAFQMGGPSGH